MFLARIEGTAVAAAKHASLEGCRLLLARRLETGGELSKEPILVVDWLGAGRNSTVLVSTDGDIARARLGDLAPVRMTVAGIVDSLPAAANSKGEGA